tara:strand:- start:98 stop:916 length:819 start_codon:yes stop_codon:yes gene_type:complete
MLLAIDIGNTNSVFALYDLQSQSQEPGHLWRFQTNAGKTEDEFAAALTELFRANDLNMADVEHIFIASVVPDADFAMAKLARNYFGCEPVFFKQELFNLDIAIDLERPSELGADRLLNAIAVREKYGSPAIVIDFGTATTFDVLKQGTERDVYAGGIIAPGVNLSLKALHDAAAKLPHIEVKAPENIIGRNTVSAMQSGVYWGYVSMIEGLIKRLQDDLGAKSQIIMTGGLAPLFAKGLSFEAKTDQSLTLYGMKYLFDQNRTAFDKQSEAA